MQKFQSKKTKLADSPVSAPAADNYLKVNWLGALSGQGRPTVGVEKSEAPASRLSSCTSKVSPSTGYSSNDNSMSQDQWPTLSKDSISSYSSSRSRACSDPEPVAKPPTTYQTVAKKTVFNESTNLDQEPIKPTAGSSKSKALAEYASRITTPYVGKYKTVICKFWSRGKACPYGLECSYAHGRSQLKRKQTYDYEQEEEYVEENYTMASKLFPKADIKDDFRKEKQVVKPILQFQADMFKPGNEDRDHYDQTQRRGSMQEDKRQSNYFDHETNSEKSLEVLAEYQMIFKDSHSTKTEKIYSSLLNEIQNLSVQKEDSEKNIYSLPVELQSVKRLGCFESICPSELYDDEVQEFTLFSVSHNFSNSSLHQLDSGKSNNCSSESSDLKIIVEEKDSEKTDDKIQDISYESMQQQLQESVGFGFKNRKGKARKFRKVCAVEHSL